MRHARHLTAILFLVFSSLSGVAVALEEPEFSVVASTAAYEIRRYGPYIVAEVDVVATSERDAGGEGFRILAGYIFGDNEQQAKMAMTAPVESSRTQKGVKMKMTAPVETSSNSDGFTYAFVMERKYTMKSLPAPLDSRIRIREKPARYVAALRFSGRWSEKNYERHRNELAAALADDGVVTAGDFTLARYNSPFALPFMRRNEVLVEVAWPDRVVRTITE